MPNRVVAQSKVYSVLEQIPAHLQPYVAEQDPSLYTPIDHASWRFILRISKAFFSKTAHQKYLDGLEETGISTERIPLISEMDQKLRRFGWRAVPVNGFLPPAVFMEFQSLGILPIACEMRTLDHLAYTPAPDIVHEAAGHAPILADQEYSNYLRAYGEVSRKAIYSHQDMMLYEAIRELSDVKENPESTTAQIAASQRRLDEAVTAQKYLSESMALARFYWWTAEYGMVGSLDNPLIYGAGLLSSVGESYSCVSANVPKVPLSLDCINMSYDITKPQPQLFIARDFVQLKDMLEKMSENMAYRIGGIEGLAKAKMARTLSTTEFESGVQVSGVLEEILTDSIGNVSFLRWSGPVQICSEDKEIFGQGADYHSGGFSSPIGTVNGRDLNRFTMDDLRALGFGDAKTQGSLKFDSGVELQGKLLGEVRLNGTLSVLTFAECSIRLGERDLYRPEWGNFDLVCGSQVVSVFGGAGDSQAFLAKTGGVNFNRIQPKSNLTQENQELCQLYAKVRELRESGLPAQDRNKASRVLSELHQQLERLDPRDWLLRLELLELSSGQGSDLEWEQTVRHRLSEISKTRQDKAEMIERGLEVLGK
jgi:phenylalanine-4-hydroxylase